MPVGRKRVMRYWEAMMESGWTASKNLSETKKARRPSWCVVAMIGIVALALTACASDVSPHKLVKEGRYEEAEAIWASRAEKGDFTSQQQLYLMYTLHKPKDPLTNEERKTYWLLKMVKNPIRPKSEIDLPPIPWTPG